MYRINSISSPYHLYNKSILTLLRLRVPSRYPPSILQASPIKVLSPHRHNNIHPSALDSYKNTRFQRQQLNSSTIQQTYSIQLWQPKKAHI